MFWLCDSFLITSQKHYLLDSFHTKAAAPLIESLLYNHDDILQNQHHFRLATTAVHSTKRTFTMSSDREGKWWLKVVFPALPSHRSDPHQAHCKHSVCHAENSSERFRIHSGGCYRKARLLCQSRGLKLKGRDLLTNVSSAVWIHALPGREDLHDTFSSKAPRQTLLTKLSGWWNKKWAQSVCFPLSISCTGRLNNRD